jgi:hypothetical protein
VGPRSELSTVTFKSIINPTYQAHNPNHLPVIFEDISRAVFRIRGGNAVLLNSEHAMLTFLLGVRRTYCDYSDFLSELCECNLYLKKDMMQFTGSFKERGARNALLSLTKSQKAAGVVCASAGNHALALAYHGKLLGIPVTCVMPRTAPLAKVDKCRKFGATIILKGEHIGEAREFAKAEYASLRYINGYDDLEIIAGEHNRFFRVMFRRVTRNPRRGDDGCRDLGAGAGRGRGAGACGRGGPDRGSVSGDQIAAAQRRGQLKRRELMLS